MLSRSCIIVKPANVSPPSDYKAQHYSYGPVHETGQPETGPTLYDDPVYPPIHNPYGPDVCCR